MEHRQIMPDMSEQDRIQILQETAHAVREGDYEAPLTEGEIENRKADFFKNGCEIDDLNEAKKEVSKEYTDKIKVLKVKNKDLRMEIKSGKTKKEGILYDLANYDLGLMETFDRTGSLVESRRLTPGEKNAQSRIFVPPHIKNGTNG